MPVGDGGREVYVGGALAACASHQQAGSLGRSGSLALVHGSVSREQAHIRLR